MTEQGALHLLTGGHDRADAAARELLESEHRADGGEGPAPRLGRLDPEFDEGRGDVGDPSRRDLADAVAHLLALGVEVEAVLPGDAPLPDPAEEHLEALPRPGCGVCLIDELVCLLALPPAAYATVWKDWT
jgi:hypothetical protein